MQLQGPVNSCFVHYRTRKSDFGKTFSSHADPDSWLEAICSKQEQTALSDTTTELIQQVREVPAMKSTPVEKILRAKRATRYKAITDQHNKKRAMP